MNKAVFLDRDGTINVDKHYLYKIEDFEFIEGAVEGLKILQDLGFILVVITNQSGIARGYYTEEEYQRLNEYMNQKLDENGVHIVKDYYCPHLPNAIVPKYRKNCNCRKPKTGLWDRAVRELDIDISQSICVGDRLRDLTICNTSECKGYLIGTTERKDIIAAIKEGSYKNFKYEPSLVDVARIIRTNI